MSDVTEIEQLVVLERQSRVRGRTEDLMACFHDDATIETSSMRGSPAAFASSGEASASGGRPPILNRLGPPVVQVNGGRAFVQLPSTTTRWLVVSGTEAILSSYMRLLYRVEQREGTWKISAMSAINEGDTLEPAVPGTDLHIDPADLIGLRPAYRFLAYSRGLDGEEVNPDLLGTDRAEPVDAVYADASMWLDA